MKNKILGFGIFLLVLVGCGGNQEPASYFEFPNDQWKRFENPLIELEVTRPGIFYTMWLELNYVPSLAPEAIPITVIMSTPSGEVRSRSLELKPEAGNDMIRVILRTNFAFTDKGTCFFEIENRSQDLDTPGMIRIGVVLERAE